LTGNLNPLIKDYSLFKDDIRFQGKRFQISHLKLLQISGSQSKEPTSAVYGLQRFSLNEFD